MAGKIIISEGVYEGEYDFDVSSLVNRDFHTIKTISGIRAGEIDDALDAADTDLIVAFSVIAIKKTGRPLIEDALWDLPAGAITYRGDKQEGDARPPDSPPGKLSNDGEKSKPSSASSETTSGSSETTP